MHQPQYKNANEKVHIITGQIQDRNSKNGGYERYTENSQKMQSGDRTVLPLDRHVACPITGRTLIAKKWVNGKIEYI